MGSCRERWRVSLRPVIDSFKQDESIGFVVGKRYATFTAFDLRLGISLCSFGQQPNLQLGPPRNLKSWP
jgi:hypothetical protein